MKKIIALSLIAVAVISFMGCDSHKQLHKARIGAILPLTGLRADLGKDCEDGIRAAIKKLSNRYGYKTPDIIFADSKGNVKDAITQYRRIRDLYGANFFIVAFSPTSRALIPYAEKDGVLLISTIASSHDFARLSKNLFRVFVSVDAETAAASNFIIKSLDSKRVAILGLDDDSGNEYVKLMRDIITSAGKYCLVEQFDDKVKDFSSLAAKIAAFQCDCVYLYCNDNRIGQIIKAVATFNNCPVVTTAAINSPANLKQLKNCKLPAIWYPDLDLDNGDRSGIDRNNICLLFAHDAMLLLGEAMYKAGDLTADNVMMQMLSLKKIKGAVGEISVDEYGDISFPMVLNKFDGNKGK